MKKIYLTTFLLMLTGLAYTQNEDHKTRSSKELMKRDFNTFIGKTLTSEFGNPNASFLFDLTKDPKVDITIPIPWKHIDRFYIDGSLSSTNNYTPIIKKGKWSPDVDLNINFTHFWFKTTNFDNIDSKNIDSKVTVDKATKIFWLWSNFKSGFNYSKFDTYVADSISLNKDKFKETEKGSFNLSADINTYWTPELKSANWISVALKLGYEYKTDDNNFSSLSERNITLFNTIIDTEGNSMTVAENEKKVRSGNIEFSNSSILNYHAMIIITPYKNLFIGFSGFGKSRLVGKLKSTDIGFGLTVPIQKKTDDDKDDKGTIASLTLKYEIPDISRKLNPDISLKDKGTLGFTIGLPINDPKNHRKK